MTPSLSVRSFSTGPSQHPETSWPSCVWFEPVHSWFIRLFVMPWGSRSERFAIWSENCSSEFPLRWTVQLDDYDNKWIFVLSLSKILILLEPLDSSYPDGAGHDKRHSSTLFTLGQKNAEHIFFVVGFIGFSLRKNWQKMTYLRLFWGYSQWSLNSFFEENKLYGNYQYSIT